MTIRRLVSALSIAAAGLIAVASGASADASCDWYAKTALKQAQENQQKGCGFTGAAWTASFSEHSKWCSTAGLDLLKAETQKRDQQLAGCKSK